MREVSGSTWVFQLMIIFILIFACFLCLVINYSKAYRVKNEMISIIEKYEGVSPTSEDIINNYLLRESYVTLGSCPTNEEWYGVNIDNGGYETARRGTQYHYCFKYSYTADRQIYYDIIVFYKFNLPIIGELMTFQVNGTTETFVGDLNRY